MGWADVLAHPGRLPLLAVAALLFVAGVRVAYLVALRRHAIAIAVVLFARLRPITVARMAGRLVLSLVLTLTALLLSAGTLLLITLTLVALIVCHGHLLRGDMATDAG